MVAAAMRAAVLYAPGEVRLEERVRPEPGPREVLVEIGAVGVCGSDVHYYEHGRIGQHVVRSPLVLGHEASGRVVALGPGASRHRVGDRVALEPGVPCGACRECRSGRYNLCRDVRFLGTPPIDGAFTDQVAIHEDFAFPLPGSVSDEAGALIEPLAVGLWACRKANVGAGDRVLVTGAGPIGLLALQAARACGATELAITDVNQRRLELAARLGATRTIDVARASVEGEYDALLECSGSTTALVDGLAALRPAGTAVAVGMGPDEDATLPLALLQTRELWLTGTFRYAGVYPAAIALAAAGRVDLEALVTGRFGLEETESALRAGREDPDAVKAMVLPRSSRSQPAT
jgi:L-iditol 2-dehydrogenase